MSSVSHAANAARVRQRAATKMISQRWSLQVRRSVPSAPFTRPPGGRCARRGEVAQDDLVERGRAISRATDEPDSRTIRRTEARHRVRVLRRRDPVGISSGRHRVVQQHVADAEDDQAVTGLLDVGDDVARKEGGCAVAAHRIGQDVEELASRQRVERGKRLVEQQDRCAGAERERQGDLGLLAAGEGSCAAIGRDVELRERGLARTRGRIPAAAGGRDRGDPRLTGRRTAPATVGRSRGWPAPSTDRATGRRP